MTENEICPDCKNSMVECVSPNWGKQWHVIGGEECLRNQLSTLRAENEKLKEERDEARAAYAAIAERATDAYCQALQDGCDANGAYDCMVEVLKKPNLGQPILARIAELEAVVGKLPKLAELTHGTEAEEND